MYLFNSKHGGTNMFEISLTAEIGNEEKTLSEFKDAFSNVDVTEYKNRYTNGKVCFIYLRLTPKAKTRTALSSGRHGRPSKLSQIQIDELKLKLSEPDCNKSRLAKEYGVTYATVLKVYKSM